MTKMTDINYLMQPEVHRNSNFELLRIIAIFGVINLHILGPFLNQVTGYNLLYAVTINVLFNTGVTLFMLISGYFGIKRSFAKGFKLYSTVIFYSLLGFLLCAWAFGDKGLLRAILPISTKRHWYITVYFIIFMISPYVNRMLETLSRREYQSLLCILLYYFYVAPTMLMIEIMEDSGKGLVNLLIVYMIGRYIRLFFDNIEISKWKLTIFTGFVFTLGIVLNYTYSIKISHGYWPAPFCRDNSIIILIAGVAIFLLFKQFSFYSGIINRIAASVFSIYIFEGALRRFIVKYGLFPYTEKLWIRATVLVIGIMVAVFILEQIRICLLANVEKSAEKKVEFCFEWIKAAKSRQVVLILILLLISLLLPFRALIIKYIKFLI